MATLPIGHPFTCSHYVKLCVSFVSDHLLYASIFPIPKDHCIGERDDYKGQEHNHNRVEAGTNLG